MSTVFSLSHLSGLMPALQLFPYQYGVCFGGMIVGVHLGDWIGEVQYT